jgi:hypothetical protein
MTTLSANQQMTEFGSTECTACGLDYELLPSILEYAAGIHDDELTSYAAAAVYKNYVRMCPRPCPCCATSYSKYINDMLMDAADWRNYYAS